MVSLKNIVSFLTTFSREAKDFAGMEDVCKSLNAYHSRIPKPIFAYTDIYI